MILGPSGLISLVMVSKPPSSSNIISLRWVVSSPSSSVTSFVINFYPSSSVVLIASLRSVLFSLIENFISVNIRTTNERRENFVMLADFSLFSCVMSFTIHFCRSSRMVLRCECFVVFLYFLESNINRSDIKTIFVVQ